MALPKAWGLVHHCVAGTPVSHPEWLSDLRGAPGAQGARNQTGFRLPPKVLIIQTVLVGPKSLHFPEPSEAKTDWLQLLETPVVQLAVIHLYGWHAKG